jgi:hypothetical protein
MPARSIAVCAATALALTALCPAADALVVARVTRHGYIMVDEPNANNVYEGHATVDGNEAMFGVISDITTAIDNAGAPHARFIAMMQTTYEPMQFAFYFGLINDARGIGAVNPLGDGREVYDINNMVGTTYPVTGFVFLNIVSLYSDPMSAAFGRYLICTQEFGHHYLAVVRVPSLPGSLQDAGSNDAGDSDAGDDDGGGGDVDAGDDVLPPIAPQEPQVLLGRQRAHWSYFVNSGGSPMEGNLWEEIQPGVFRTGTPSFRFSPLDLYVMGLMPPSSVPPFWVIVDPDVLDQRDLNGEVIFRESPPEYEGRTVSIRGRRLTYTIDDVIRANGPRVPSNDTLDAGGSDADGEGGARVIPDLDVTWALLTTPDQVTDQLADQFDQAIESCTMGYDGASDNRSRLIAVVPQDAGDGGADAAADGAAHDAGFQPDVPADAFTPPDLNATGGCGACSALPARSGTGLLGAAGVLAAIAFRRRRPRRVEHTA